MSAFPDIYQSHNELLARVEKTLKPGEEFNLRGIQVPHYEIRDTAMAACFATLDIPFREPGAYTDAVDLDENDNEKGRFVIWWMADGPRAHPEAPPQTAEETAQRRTEWLVGAWIERARFEKEHPLHPLVAMRAALEARKWWLTHIDAWRKGAATLPTEVQGDVFRTEHIAAAAVLRACGFRCLGFTGRAFLLDRARGGVAAEQILAEAAKPTGASPAQWMSRALLNYSHLVGVAKRHSTILRQRFDDQTLLLSVDATPKTVEKFRKLL